MTKAAKMSITELRNRLDAASQRVSDASRSGDEGSYRHNWAQYAKYRAELMRRNAFLQG